MFKRNDEDWKERISQHLAKYKGLAPGDIVLYNNTPYRILVIDLATGIQIESVKAVGHPGGYQGKLMCTVLDPKELTPIPAGKVLYGG